MLLADQQFLYYLIEAMRSLTSDPVMSCDAIVLLISKEVEYGKKSPLNSVYALDGICSACKSNDDLKWCLAGIKDCLLFQGCNTSDFSVRSLLGKNKQKGQVHLLLFKRQLLSYLHLDFAFFPSFASIYTTQI